MLWNVLIGHWRLLSAWNLLSQLSVLGVGLFPAGAVSENEAMWPWRRSTNTVFFLVVGRR